MLIEVCRYLMNAVQLVKNTKVTKFLAWRS